MARPTLKGDLEFIKSEILLGLKWLRKYFKDKSDDGKKDRIVSMLEFGPFEGLKLLVVIIITLIFLFSFSLLRSEATFWVLISIFIICYDLFFGKGWIVPVLKELLLVFYATLKEFVMGTLEFIKVVLLGIKDMLMGMSPWKSGE
jgi:hypothetical protein